jgi:hypothetical protein
VKGSFELSAVPSEFMSSDVRPHAGWDFEPKILFIAQTAGSTLEDSDFGVETLHKTQRHFVPGLAVSRDPVPMTVNHAGKFLLGLQTLPFERLLPVLKEAPRPRLALAVPQLTEGFLEQTGDVQTLVGLG